MRQRLQVLWSGLSRAARIVIITIAVLVLTVLGLALALTFSGGSSKSAAPTTTMIVTTTAPAATPTAPSTTTSTSASTSTTATAPSTTTGTSTSTAAPSTTPSVTTPTSSTASPSPSNAPAPSGTPWPGPTTSSPAPAPGGTTQTYPIDGRIHVYVDLNSVVHDGVLAHFSFTAINGMDHTIQFSRAAVSIGLDKLDFTWQPIHNLEGPFGFLDGGGWYVRTGSIAPGQRIDFQGMVLIPVRNPKSNPYPTVSCLQGDLQVIYPGKPNASQESNNFSDASCGEYSAG